MRHRAQCLRCAQSSGQRLLMPAKASGPGGRGARRDASETVNTCRGNESAVTRAGGRRADGLRHESPSEKRLLALSKSSREAARQKRPFISTDCKWEHNGVSMAFPGAETELPLAKWQN
jgi:hypothetical protein